jgi:hypothetical protein
MSDLADQVNTRGKNVIPQSELGRAWDQLNQERRAEGQPDSPGSARGQQGQQQPPRQPGQGQQGQGQNGQNGQNGQSNQPQNGQGIGTAPSNGGPPGEQQAGDPAPRLDTQGQPVQVDLKPGQNDSTKPGDADKPDDDQPKDEAGSIANASAASPGQVTSAAPPEINFVPSGRRDIVREYFRGPGEARPQ